MPFLLLSALAVLQEPLNVIAMGVGAVTVLLVAEILSWAILILLPVIAAAITSPFAVALQVGVTAIACGVALPVQFLVLSPALVMAKWQIPSVLVLANPMLFLVVLLTRLIRLVVLLLVVVMVQVLPLAPRLSPVVALVLVAMAKVNRFVLTV